MEREILSVRPKIINLSEANDIYMELTMCILTNQKNLNNLRFTNDYIDGIVDNKERYIGIPLVGKREKLEHGEYENLTHELNKGTGLLETDSLGSFVDFWKEMDEDGTLKLMGLVRVYKRYPNVCNAIIKLFSSDELEFSCEIFAYGYSEINEITNERLVNYQYEGLINSLFGSCIVSYPAEQKSKASILVAEALEKDINEVDKVNTLPQNFMENTNKNEQKGEIEMNEEFQKEFDLLQEQIGKLNETIVAQQVMIAEYAKEFEILKPYKEQVETAEFESKIEKMTDKYANLLSDELMKSEAVISAIQSLDEQSLNAIVVENVAKEVASRMETGKKQEKVVVIAEKHQDLIPETLLQKYGIN